MILISIAALLASGATSAQLRSGSISDADYPNSARKVRAEGIVVARYVVGPQGMVTSCEVATSSGHPALDSTTCALIQRRFRFLPAVDAKGNPMSEQRSHRVVWRLPAEPVAEPGETGE